MKHNWFKSVYYAFNNLKFRLGRRDVKLDGKVQLAPDAKLLGKNSLGTRTYFNGELGYGSYIGNDCRIRGRVGKYCSIGSNINVVCGNHPSNTFVSTHPMFFSTVKQNGYTYVKECKFEENEFADNTNFPVIIGNDVWIGNDVLIKAGVTIGDGAIIAIGAVVTKDVEPYAIVGGVPAKTLRYRFEKDQIARLLELKWWDKPEEWIERNADYFSNIDLFIEELENGRLQ